jgi:hypothetical protein
VGGCAAGTYYRDQDQDGYGGADGVACAPSVGFVAIGGDCDDSSGFVYPGAREFCDGADDDCNLMVDDAAGCPAGAEGHLGFGGKPYLRLATPLPYSTAVQTCLDAGMYLVRVESQEEHDYLWSIAGNLTTFIGATDSAGEGTWSWSSNGDVFWSGSENGASAGGFYNNWMPGVEPNDMTGEDCAVLWPGHGGRWADDKCGASYPAFCEAAP